MAKRKNTPQATKTEREELFATCRKILVEAFAEFIEIEPRGRIAAARLLQDDAVDTFAALCVYHQWIMSSDPGIPMPDETASLLNAAASEIIGQLRFEPSAAKRLAAKFHQRVTGERHQTQGSNWEFALTQAAECEIHAVWDATVCDLGWAICLDRGQYRPELEALKVFLSNRLTDPRGPYWASLERPNDDDDGGGPGEPEPDPRDPVLESAL